MSYKDIKKLEMLTHLAAQYISREAGRSTLITATRADLSPDGKHATIFVSVYPTDEGEHAIVFLMRHKDDFRDYLKSHARFPVLPYITFEIDYGELNRQHLDEVSRDVGHIPDAEPEDTEGM